MKKYFLFTLILFPLLAMGQTGSLFACASLGDLPCVKRLVEQGADVNAKIHEDHDKTPLMGAAWKGYRDVVEYLLDHHADINAIQTTGSSALMEAVWGGHADIAKLLISKGADVNDQIPGANTVYSVAVWKNETEIVSLLKSKDAKEAPTYP